MKRLGEVGGVILVGLEPRAALNFLYMFTAINVSLGIIAVVLILVNVRLAGWIKECITNRVAYTEAVQRKMDRNLMVVFIFIILVLSYVTYLLIHYIRK